MYTDLLTQFANQLNDKLNANETIQAMSKQGMYPLLMKEFISLLK
ncbi:DUF1878 family protein [Metabacillus niabensis]